MGDISSFKDMDLSSEIMSALRKMSVTTPTTVQKEVIPPFMDNQNIIAKAPTGTGKTFAFGIPILEYLNMESKFVQALILVPTRELALQIVTEIKALGRAIPGLKVSGVIGGQSIRVQEEKLRKKPQIVVATPGRLLDLVERRAIDISQIYTLVLDEADEMLKMGFIRDIKRVMNITPSDKQIALFSATMPREIMDITWEFMEGAIEIDVEPVASDYPNIDQYMIELPEKDKVSRIISIMEEEASRKGIVFCNTKRQTEDVACRLISAGLSCEMLHGDIGQGRRTKIMDLFRNDKFDILVATDVIARGIDVDDVEVVFNYDIPKENEFYLHRIGRTGRAGHYGKAFSLVSFKEKTRMEEIIRYTKASVSLYVESV